MATTPQDPAEAAKVLVRTDIGFRLDVSSVEGLGDVPVIDEKGIEVTREQADRIKTVSKWDGVNQPVHISQIKEGSR